MNNKGEPSIIFSLLSLKRKKWIRFKKIFATPSIQTLVNISVNFGWNNNLKILVTWHKHLVSVYVKWVIGFNWILLLHILSFKTKNAAALWDLLFSWWRGGTQVWTEFDANTWGHILYHPNLCKTKTNKRCLRLGRKVMTNLDSILKSRDITLPTKIHLVKAMVFALSCIDVRVGL